MLQASAKASPKDGTWWTPVSALGVSLGVGPRVWGLSAPATRSPLGFAGGLTDADTGLVLFGARDFDPALGRWLAKDPIGFAGGDVNLYGYCLEDPVGLVDPSGQMSQECIEYWQDEAAKYAEQAMWWDTASQAARNVAYVDAAVGAWALYAAGPAIAAWWAAYGAGGASTGFLADKAYEYATDSNKLDHIFRSKHKLEGLVEQFGSNEAVVNEVLQSAQGLTPASGVFEVTTTVGGQTVVVTGAVVDGVIKIGSFWVP